MAKALDYAGLTRYDTKLKEYIDATDLTSDKVTAMTGYSKPSTAPSNASIQTTDSLNTAVGKLEYKLGDLSGFETT